MPGDVRILPPAPTGIQIDVISVECRIITNGGHEMDFEPYNL